MINGWVQIKRRAIPFKIFSVVKVSRPEKNIILLSASSFKEDYLDL
jgi:hypothetical protein